MLRVADLRWFGGAGEVVLGAGGEGCGRRVADCRWGWW